jgi:hypothetical protein
MSTPKELTSWLRLLRRQGLSVTPTGSGHWWIRDGSHPGGRRQHAEGQRRSCSSPGSRSRPGEVEPMTTASAIDTSVIFSNPVWMR